MSMYDDVEREARSDWLDERELSADYFDAELEYERRDIELEQAGYDADERAEYEAECMSLAEANAEVAAMIADQAERAAEEYLPPAVACRRYGHWICRTPGHVNEGHCNRCGQEG